MHKKLTLKTAIPLNCLPAFKMKLKLLLLLFFIFICCFSIPIRKGPDTLFKVIKLNI